MERLLKEMLERKQADLDHEQFNHDEATAQARRANNWVTTVEGRIAELREDIATLEGAIAALLPPEES